MLQREQHRNSCQWRADEGLEDADVEDIMNTGVLRQL
jgi:hypothetical protein